MQKTFPGGRRWAPGGFFYKKRIEPLPRPTDLAVPLWRGGTAVVEPGEKVKAFGLLGHDKDGLPVHSPLGGRIRDVGDFPHLLARPKQFDFPRRTVFIDVDRKQAEAVPPYRPLPRYWELTHQELCQRLLEAGVMDVCHRDLPQHIIYNALDLEPPLAANLRLLEERPGQALEGMRILNQLHNAVRSRVVLASGFPRLEARLRTMLASSVNLSLHIVDPVYPQGHPALLKNELFPEERCSIYNMTDAIRVREALVLGRPVVESHLTARNEPGKSAMNLTVPIGTPAGHVLWWDGQESRAWRTTARAESGQSSFVSHPDPSARHSMVFGGLLSGRGFYSMEMPVQADTVGLMLLEQKRPGPAPCINCGACHRRCPSRLHPSEIFRQVARLDTRRLAELGLDRCLGCGLCSWVCPSKIELVQQIGVGRMLLEGRK